MINTLDRYIGKSILGAIFATLMTLVGLSAIIKFVEQFRSVGKGTYDIWQAVIFTGLTMPKDIETFFPMAALLGALIALGNLASRSELVIMQSAGFSRFKIGIAVMKTALPLVVFTMIIGEWEFHKQNNLHEICVLRLFLVVQYFQLKMVCGRKMVIILYLLGV